MQLSDAGLCQFDPRTEKFTNLRIGSQRTFVSARLIVEDSIDGSPNGWALWIGTNDGLWRYDARANAFARYAHDPRDPKSLASNIVTTVYRDTRGTLWIGTDQGLDRMDLTAGRFESYTVDDGLPENLVLGILEDGEGRLWVSTAKAISKLDPRTNRFSTYTMKDVLPDIRFGAGCCLRSPTGEMYFGGRGGIIVFHPDSIRDNPYVPPIAVTGFRRFDAPAHLDSAVSEKRTIDLSYKDNVFSFEFAALNFVRPEQNQYAYTLEGHDSGWIYCGNRQYARYMNVPVGNYVFRVRGSNNDGVWNEEGVSLRILIAPPYWQTWWFRGVALVLLGALAYGGYRYRLAKMLALERLRLRIANDLHDDIGSDLSSLALESDLLSRRFPEGDPSRERLRVVGRTIRAAADNLRDVVWIVSPDRDEVQDLVERMREVAAKMLSGFSYEFRCSGSAPSGSLDIEFKRHVLMMFKEMLHNVVRHARASKVEVEFELITGHLRLCVRDDGVGFEPSAKQSGRGLYSLRARASAIGGTVTIESAPGKGTAISLEAGITRL
jgi:signal transduction histidine kinase